jgi:hypothetical protein
VTDNATPELIPDTTLGKANHKTAWQLIPTDRTTQEVRPETVLVALMQAGPGEPLQESIEEAEPLIEAIEYAALCLNAEDTYILNAINSEGITFDELGARLGVSKTHSHRLYGRALNRLRTLLLNHPPVRERLGMEQTWNAAAMQELVAIASYEEDWPDGNPPYPLTEATDDVCRNIDAAISHFQNGYEKYIHQQTNLRPWPWTEAKLLLKSLWNLNIKSCLKRPQSIKAQNKIS